MENHLNLSISMVVYKPNLLVLGRALSSLSSAIQAAGRQHSLTTILYLIDNSCDESWSNKVRPLLATFQQNEMTDAQFIVSKKNGGYGQGNNLGILKSLAKYHLVINPDVYVDTDSISNAISFLERNSTVSLLVPAVRGENNERHFLCKQNPTLFIMFLRGFAPLWLQNIFRNKLDSFEMLSANYDANIDHIEYPTGCFMFFRGDLLRKIGGFDPDYFLHMEDADIGRRISSLGKITYVPEVSIIHLWARGSHRNLWIRWATIKSAFIYWKKWGGIF